MNRSIVALALLWAGILGSAPLRAGEALAPKPPADKPAAAQTAARAPKTAAEAFKGVWTGTWDLTKGAHGQKPMQTAANLEFDGLWQTTSGVVGGNLKIASGRLKSFDLTSRAANFDLTYKMGNSPYTLNFTGAFSADWLTLEGNLTSIIGSGTLTLMFGPGHEMKAGKPKAAGN